MGYVSKVRKFAEACSSNLTEFPKKLTIDEISFIREMVNDELQELEDAKDITEQADALVDAIYYLCHCAAKHGMNLDPLFQIVHQANMKKIVNGKILKREDGKILKPKGWEDPKDDLEAEIKRQTRFGAFA